MALLSLIATVMSLLYPAKVAAEALREGPSLSYNAATTYEPFAAAHPTGSPHRPLCRVGAAVRGVSML